MNERAGLTERATTGRIEAGVHTMALRVYYEDTDASGIVYYANYLKFIERARTDLLRMVGITHSGTQASDGVAFTVRRCEIDYRAPARLDDEIEVQNAASQGSAALPWMLCRPCAAAATTWWLPSCKSPELNAAFVPLLKEHIRQWNNAKPLPRQVRELLSLTLHSSLC